MVNVSVYKCHKEFSKDKKKYQMLATLFKNIKFKIHIKCNLRIKLTQIQLIKIEKSQNDKYKLFANKQLLKSK